MECKIILMPARTSRFHPYEIVCYIPFIVYDQASEDGPYYRLIGDIVHDWMTDHDLLGQVGLISYIALEN